MLCESCRRQEAVFHYTRSINGEISERHLCQACAARLQYPSLLEEENAPMLGALLSQLVGGWIVIPTVIAPGSTEGTTGEAPKNRLRGDAAENRLRGEAADPKQDADCTETAGWTISESMASKLRIRREIQLLYRQLKKAADTQDYERAAGLRDRIKDLESMGENTSTEK